MSSTVPPTPANTVLENQRQVHYNINMELKALAAALFVAFFTVIMDAIFNFHYIYVLLILVILGYVLVRLISITSTTSGSGAAAPETKETGLGNLLESAAKAAAVTLEMDGESTENTVRVDEGAFRDALAAGLAAFGIKTHGQTTVVRSGNRKMVHIVLTVNRKAGAIQEKLDTAITTLRQLLCQDGGSAWQTDIPRKTELHILIPGN